MLTLLAHLDEDETLKPLIEMSRSDELFAEGIRQTYLAGIQFGIATIAILVFWFWLSKRPVPQKPFTERDELRLAQCIAAFTVIATGCVSWDLWWHRAVGRDMFWETPHIFLYLFALIAISGSLYGWYRTRKVLWKRLAITLLLVPFSAPFDQFWHTIFGVEDLSQPEYLIWSPPHLTVALSAMFAQIWLLPVLSRDKNADSRNLMGMIVFGTLTATCLYLLLPVHPTDGFGQLIGFWGAGLQATVIIGGPLIARHWLHDRFGGIKIAPLVSCMQLVAYGKETAEGIIMLPHDRMPNWVIIFAVFIGAIWVDLTDDMQRWLRGLLGGALAAFMMYWTARYFLAPEFWYGNTEVTIAVFAGALGGLAAVFVAQVLNEKIDRAVG